MWINCLIVYCFYDTSLCIGKSKYDTPTEKRKTGKVLNFLSYLNVDSDSEYFVIARGTVHGDASVAII